MKAARFYEVNESLRVEEVPVPEVQEDEVLVQTRAVGLCGSDIHIVFEGVTPTAFTPITLGHEPSGEVAHTGICLTRRLIGIQAEGALAEYVVVPAKNLVRLPENVPFTVGAIITDAIATPFHALMDRAVLKVGESVAIYGVGGLGLHAVQIARLLGATKIFVVDPREEQLERAKRLGGDVTINPEENSPVEAILEATGGLGVDVAVELVGLEQTVAQAVESLARGSRAVVVGLGPDAIKTVPPTVFVRDQISLLGSYAFTKRNVEQLVDLAAAGRLDLEGSITHTFPLDEVNKGLEYLHEKIENPIRVAITVL